MNPCILKPNEYIELVDEGGLLKGALLTHSEDTKEKILSFYRLSNESNNCGHSGTVSGAILDKLGSMTSLIAPGLQAGNLMQMVGTPALLEGLKSGAFALMKTAEGSTGTVVNSSHIIVGQIRFSPASIAPVVTPMAIWQVLNAVAGVHQLSKINARLDSLQRTIESIQIRQQANSYGRLKSALLTLEDLEEEHRHIGRFSNDMVMRLSLASQEIQAIYFEYGFMINRFKEKSEEIINRSEKKRGAVAANTLLGEESNSYLFDANIFMMAAKASLISSKAWLTHDLEHVPEYAGYRMADLQQEIATLQEIVSPLTIIEELQEHAENCFNEMKWFNRNITNRGLGRAIHKRSEILETEKNNTAVENEQNSAQSLLIWKDYNGSIKVVSAPCCLE